MTREQNIDIFHETRDYSISNTSMIRKLKKDTIVYSDSSLLECLIEPPRFLVRCAVGFINKGTVSTAYEEARTGNRVAILNFADGLCPGGLVEDGEYTQEENICRCTNLYESLITDIAKVNYYQFNKKYSYEDIYTNALIYSSGVSIFRDDATYDWYRRSRKVDVISCAAPCGGNTKELESLIFERMKGILLSAILHDVDTLILGAWGCGAFGQDRDIIAGLFGKAVKRYDKYFKKVIFAIRGSHSGQSDITRFSLQFFKEFGYGI